MPQHTVSMNHWQVKAVLTWKQEAGFKETEILPQIAQNPRHLTWHTGESQYYGKFKEACGFEAWQCICDTVAGFWNQELDCIP